MVVEALYHDGILKPVKPIDLADGEWVNWRLPGVGPRKQVNVVSLRGIWRQHIQSTDEGDWVSDTIANPARDQSQARTPGSGNGRGAGRWLSQSITLRTPTVCSGICTMCRAWDRVRRQLFARLAPARATLLIPAIVLAEIVHTVERRRHDIDVNQALDRISEADNFRVLPFDLVATRALIDLTDIPEIHDRIIVAAARDFDAPLITRDQTITASGLAEVVW